VLIEKSLAAANKLILISASPAAYREFFNGDDTSLF
jgi:hypothetical protein